ncbi:MAG TPA: indolepyruvate oxidoreductase subunit beta [Dehalococcoidia bacterium]|nr:indolepyruvate oxidoreductase subunit beta [Dehalococcoidia bacterium]
MKKFDLLVTGVGGQGVILASNIIGEVALAAGYDVKKTDTLGMAQRGGSVVSHVRLGRGVYSPLIKADEVDIMVAFEKLEAARWSHYLRPGAVAIVNNHAQFPLSVNLGDEPYPDDGEIVGILRRSTERIYLIDGTSRVEALGNPRTLNVFLLGCASVFLPLKIRVWQDIISQRVPPGVQKLNITAFNRGRKEMRRVYLRQGAAEYGARVVDTEDVRGGGRA